MKTKLLIVIFLSILSYHSYSQTQEATLFFKDGDSIQGYGMIKNNKVKFRVSLDSKADFWDFESITKIEFYEFTFYKTYEYVKLNSYDYPMLLELVTKGEVTLYKQEKSKWVAGIPQGINDDTNFPVKKDEFGRDVIPGTEYERTVTKNYLKRNEDEFPTCVNCGVFNKWKKNTIEFLSDCELLIKKIKNREFREIHMQEIVEYYNDFCTEL